ncbi:FAD/NAD(P)-binding domain-containing protein [Heliocybe sulcata]|uniref:FAD/NAD(P)-binding domain-containing protein n=1 Tax=Heliocybe sulcata TaxID=5364 RepID=A0A5C3MRK0_9AGAM|nr:FAD/NAD(P)-binding domain-containing protein [Heliocybe sulcata]
MTWDFRTFQTKPRIRPFLQSRLGTSKITSLSLNDSTVQLERPYPDLAWVQALFTFEAAAGKASGVVRLVPVLTSNGRLEWKAHTVLTNLEGLRGFPEKIGSLRDQLPNHGKWLEKRRREIEFLDEEPKVIIVGAGQSGLEIAARLKYLDVPALVVERHPRIGHNWRTRYEALCLHDSVWYDHMPYIPFPPSWPVYTPAMKLADWLESYAHSLELNVWTSSDIARAEQDETTKKWTITIRRGEAGQERTFTVDHLVCALGIGGGFPRMPVYAGMEQFSGRIIHSAHHKTARDHIGKKVVVVGSCTSAHDICAEHAEQGIDVTMVQRSPTYIMSTKEGIPRLLAIYSENGPPTDVADRINASYPNPLMKLMHQRLVKDIAEADKDILQGLERVGFKLGWGEDGSGFLYLAWKKAGGYYLDVGASQMIIDGKIKLKNDSLIDHFTETGISFQDGSELKCDVVIFATGYDQPRDAVIRLLGGKFSDKVKPIWGLNDEGEFNGNWRDLGVPNLWYMIGNLALCRFHSKHLAMQIKALQEGVWDGSRYTA